MPLPRSGYGTAPVERTAAVLVAVQLPGVTDVDHAADLAELGRLVHTLGFDVVATVTQRRDALAAAAVLGEGKLKELAALTGGKGVVPSGAPEQKIEGARPLRSRRAARTTSGDEPRRRRGRGPSATRAAEGHRRRRRSRDHPEPGAQPRARDRRRGARSHRRHRRDLPSPRQEPRGPARRSRSRGSTTSRRACARRAAAATGSAAASAARAPASRALELDRRKIRDRIAELREELARIQKEHDDAPPCAARMQLRVALVGYTNAGKSSLMRALTGSDVLVADKLFATLDTTVRALHPETQAAPPRLGHRRLHQEAARTISSRRFARRSTRRSRRRSCSTSSTPRIPTHDAPARGDARGAPRDRRRRRAEPAPAQQDRSRRRRRRAPRSRVEYPDAIQLSREGRGRRRGAARADRRSTSRHRDGRGRARSCRTRASPSSATSTRARASSARSGTKPAARSRSALRPRQSPHSKAALAR